MSDYFSSPIFDSYPSISTQGGVDAIYHTASHASNNYMDSDLYWHRHDTPHPGGLDWQSRFLFGDPWDTTYDNNTIKNLAYNPERQALWDSMPLGEKIVGTLLSLLVGGGTPFLLGYIFT